MIATTTPPSRSLQRMVRPQGWKRKVVWSEMAQPLRVAALQKLRGLAKAKAEYDGTLLPYAWAERIAPKLRYTLTARGQTVWDCQPTPDDRAAGYSVFTLPPLSLDECERVMRPNRKSAKRRFGPARFGLAERVSHAGDFTLVPR